MTTAALELGLHINIVQLPGLGGVIRMAPPLTIEESELHQGIDLLEQSIARALRAEGYQSPSAANRSPMRRWVAESGWRLSGSGSRSASAAP